MRTRWVAGIVTLATMLFGVGPAAAAPGPAVQSSNGKIAFQSYADGDYDIYTMDADGSNVQNLTDAFGPFTDTDPSWSPDGTRIAFNSDRAQTGGSDIFVMNEDGSNQVSLTESGQIPGENFGAAWSPDGTKIAFTSTRGGDWDVFVMNADGSNETDITSPNQTLAYDDMNPDWAPDGSKIVFQGVRDGAWEILLANPDGTGEQNLTAEDDPPYANINWAPTFSPDGSRILYMSQPNDGSNEWDIWVMNADGSGKVDVLPDDAYEDVGPAWSPDGTQITFSGNRSGFGTDIYVMDYPPPQPILVTQVPDAPAITAGDQAGYTIAVYNRSSTPADGVTLTDVLPTDSGTSWTIDLGGQGCSIASGTLTCDFGQLGANEASPYLHVSSPTDLGTAADSPIDNTATVTTTNAGTDSVTASIAVSGASAALNGGQSPTSGTGGVQQLTQNGSSTSPSWQPVTGESPGVHSFRAVLRGTGEAPGPGDPDGRGKAAIQISVSSRTLCYLIKVSGIALPAAGAVIGRGAAGVAGRVVLKLAAPGAAGSASGCLTGVNQSLLQDMAADPSGYYLDVRTSEVRSGAIRGQLG
jgi:uncharacterized repeat protein (TIGR01451 family)